MSESPVKSIVYSDLEYEDFHVSEPTIYSIQYNEVKYEILLHYKPGNREAVVFGNGDVATTGKTYNYPFWSRGTWAAELPFNAIYYFDPTVYLGEATLCWCYGENRRWYLKDIANIIEKILKKLQIKIDHVVFSGSSGGGFTSIMLATMMRGKVACINPQLSAIDYHPHKVEELKESVLKEGECLIVERLKCISYFIETNYIPQIYIKQNLNSKYDVEKQMLPFLKSVSELRFDCKGRIVYEFYNNEGGHNAMPGKEETINWIKEKIKLPLLELPKVNQTGYIVKESRLYFYLDMSREINDKKDPLKLTFDLDKEFKFSFFLMEKGNNNIIEQIQNVSKPYCVFSLPGEGQYKIECIINDGEKRLKFFAKGIEVYSGKKEEQTIANEAEIIEYIDSQMESITQVHGEYETEGNKLSFRLIFTDGNGKKVNGNASDEYAFYLVKDRVAIQKIFYSEDSFCSFDLPSSGVYTIKYYIKHDGLKTSYQVKNINVDF